MNDFAGVTDDTGNCYAATIASITGIPFDALRADVGPLHYIDRDKRRELSNRMVRLLEAHGWAILNTGARAPVGLSVAVGPSPRGSWNHCWVALDGKPYFDPHPSAEYTVTVDHYEVLVKIVAVTA